jgi:hypothetical protein
MSNLSDLEFIEILNGLEDAGMITREKSKLI